MALVTGLPPRKYLTVGEVASRLVVSTQSVLREIRDGELKALKIRGRYRVGETDLANYEAAHYTGKCD